MFEALTYEAILEDMLSRVVSDVDKREGSIIYDALAPCAYHLAQTYFLLDYYKDLFFIDTTIGEYLDRKAADFGFTRKPATYAVRMITTSGEVDIGTRWGIEGITYTIKEKLSINKYSATSEQSGIIGIIYSGALENIDNVSGITATLTEVISSGTDEESDDDLRLRIREHLINPSRDGNVAQYKKWATEYEGIGAARVFPLRNGGNTVEIAITNANYHPAELSLVEKFQAYIDPGSSGLGNGVAPIGCKVKVISGTKKEISVSADITLADGYSKVEGAIEAIESYLASITFIKNIVSYMRIGSVLLDCDSIIDLSNLKVNGGIVDIPLTAEEIPVLTSISLVVAST